MSPTKNDSSTIASYVLIIGSILSILPNIPIVNQTLPIYKFDAIFVQGGANFLETFLLVGNYQGTYSAINGWTLLAIPGTVLWIIFVGIGIIGIIVSMLFDKKLYISLVGIIGGLIELILLILIFLGNSRDVTKFGLSNFAFPNTQFIGIGFWVLIIGAILLLASGLFILKK